MESYLKETQAVYKAIIDYLENENDEENNFNTFIDKIIENKDQLKMALKLFSSITRNHKRSNQLIQKTEKIILSIKMQIHSYFTNHEIFDIFEKSKIMLLFLFKEKLIQPDSHIFSIISNSKNTKRNYPSFFYPEFISFFTKELIQENNINQINLEEFYLKREIGENDNYISQLIRNDSIKEFIIYVNKNNLSLSYMLNPSIYETNDYLIDKNPSLIEYASFYGSFQIFQFLRLNQIELKPSLWIYAIHGRNADIIHLLEEDRVSPSSYFDCLCESIKCHHNELKDYFQTNFIDNLDDSLSNILIKSIKYFNLIDLSENILRNSDVFCYLCKYDYVNIVSLLLDSKTNNIDINKKKEKNKSVFFYENALFEKRIVEKKTPLIVAIEKGNQKIVETLITQKNIDINSKFESRFAYYNEKGEWTYHSGEYKKTPLYIAIEKGYSKIVQLLINHEDINVNEVNIDDNKITKKLSALHLAIENEQIEIIKMLLNSENIDTNLIEYESISSFDHYEKTPLIIAIFKENIQIVQLLLSKKETNPNIIYHYYVYVVEFDGWNHDETNEKLTPLQLAIIKENKQIIQILLNSKKIDINDIGYQYIVHDKLNKTALHIAVEKNNFDIVKMLLSYEGIDVNTVSIYNYEIEKYKKGFRYYEHKIVEKTALLVAVENNNLEIINLLLEHKNTDINKELTFTSYVRTSDPTIDYNKSEKMKIIDVAIQNNNQATINALLFPSTADSPKKI